MRKTSIVIFFTIAMYAGYSQSFMHGAGVGIFVADAPNTDITAGGMLTYSPRFNFLENESLSLSLGIPLSVGFSGNYNYSYSSYYGSSEENTLKLMFNAPLILNLNVGTGSTKENEKRFGFFAGGGFAYHYGSYVKEIKGGDYTDYVEEYGSSYGPAGNIGVRIAVGSHQKSIEARLSYMKAVSESKTSLFGIAALFNF